MINSDVLLFIFFSLPICITVPVTSRATTSPHKFPLTIGQKLHGRCAKGPYDNIFYIKSPNRHWSDARMNLTRSLLKIARHRVMDRFLVRYHLTCSITGDNEYLQVIRENKTHYFPLVWLRDNCQCEKCYHEQSSSRILNWDSFNVDVKTEFVEVR